MTISRRLFVQLLSPTGIAQSNNVLQRGKQTTRKLCIGNELYVKRHSSTHYGLQKCQLTKTCLLSRDVFVSNKHMNYSTERPSTVNIDASPRYCLLDVPTKIEIKGLSPGQQITLKMETVDEKNILYDSFAHYTADNNGQVNVETDASTGGSYTGVFPHGLLSSLKPAAGMKIYARILKKDVYSPLNYNVTVHEGTHDVVDVGPPVAHILLQRIYALPGVKRIPVEEGKLYGTLFLPEGPGPFPSVIDLGGGMGGLAEFRSAMTASRGIASFAVPYFDYKDLPVGPENVDAIFISKAADYLLKNPKVIPDRCGIMSNCLGTVYALAAASFDDRLKALAGISPIVFAYGMNLRYKGKLLMKKMEPHFYTMNFENDNYMKFNEDIYKSKYLNVESECLFPIEICAKDTHILLGGGTDDTFLSEFAIKSLKERANRVGNFNIEYVEYKGAGHILEAPYGPFFPFSYQHYYPFREGSPESIKGKKGVMMLWGGNNLSNCYAQEDWWKRSINFVKKHIRDNSPWYQSYLLNDINNSKQISFNN